MSGFNVNFLGENYKVNFPSLGNELSEVSLNNGEIFDFTHFSLVMNKVMKSAICVASNIDKSQQTSIEAVSYTHLSLNKSALVPITSCPSFVSKTTLEGSIIASVFIISESTLTKDKFS